MNLFQEQGVKDYERAAAQIPVIDFGPCFAGDPGALGRTAPVVRHACEAVGFFYALNHGVPEALIARAFAASRRFHALPLDDKLKLRLNENNIGYLPIKRLGAGRLDRAQGDKAEPERKLFHQPRPRVRPSRRCRRDAVARAQSVAGRAARDAP